MVQVLDLSPSTYSNPDLIKPTQIPQEKIITQEAEVAVVRKRMLSNGIREGEVVLPEAVDWKEIFGAQVAAQFTEADIAALSHYIAGYPMKRGLMEMPFADKTAFEHIANVMGISTTAKRPSAEFVAEFTEAFQAAVNNFKDQRIFGNWSMAIDQLANELEKVVRQNSF
jgi:hypothetical protein